MVPELEGQPQVEVLAGKHSGRYVAREITEPRKRDRAWQLAVDRYAGYSDYEIRAGDRDIPLLLLERTIQRCQAAANASVRFCQSATD